MPAPTNKKQVQSFIGMINSLSKFSARLSEIVEPIWKLPRTRYLSTGAQNINLLLYRWSKKMQVLLYWLTAILRSKLSCKLMQASRDQVHICCRNKTSIFCQQSFNRSTAGICSYWVRITCSCLGDGQVSSFPVCKLHHIGNWSEALGSYFI